MRFIRAIADSIAIPSVDAWKVHCTRVQLVPQVHGPSYPMIQAVILVERVEVRGYIMRVVDRPCTYIYHRAHDLETSVFYIVARFEVK